MFFEFAFFVTIFSTVFAHHEGKCHDPDSIHPQEPVDLNKLGGTWYTPQFWIFGLESDDEIGRIEHRCLQDNFIRMNADPFAFDVISRSILNGNESFTNGFLKFHEKNPARHTIYLNGGVYEGVSILSDDDETSGWRIDYWCMTGEDQNRGFLEIHTRERIIDEEKGSELIKLAQDLIRNQFKPPENQIIKIVVGQEGCDY